MQWVGSPPQAPFSLPHSGLWQRPPQELAGACFFSGGVGGAHAPGKAPSGQCGQGLQDCSATGRAQLPGGEGCCASRGSSSDWSFWGS